MPPGGAALPSRRALVAGALGLGVLGLSACGTPSGGRGAGATGAGGSGWATLGPPETSTTTTPAPTATVTSAGTVSRTGALKPAEFLPYGTTFEWNGGVRSTMVRLPGPALSVPSGLLAFSDPAFMRYDRAITPVGLPGGDLPTELGVFDFEAPGKPGLKTRRAGVVAVGQVGAVVEWRPVLGLTGDQLTFPVDAGTGCAFSARDFAGVVDSIGNSDAVIAAVMADAVAPVRVGGRVAAIAFDCGMGDGAYPVFAGLDASGATVAVGADLEIHHHAASSTPSATPTTSTTTTP